MMGLLLIFLGRDAWDYRFFMLPLSPTIIDGKLRSACELCDLHCQSLLHFIIAEFDIAANYAICTVGDASHLLYPCNLSVDAISIVFDKQF